MEDDDEVKNPTCTTRTLTKNGPWLSKDPSMQSVECILAELNTELQKESSVPFPEFGVDIILHHKEEGKYTYIYCWQKLEKEKNITAAGRKNARAAILKVGKVLLFPNPLWSRKL